MSLLGTPVRRVEDPRLLAGRHRYVADLDLPGVLHVAFVTSTVAHARLLSVGLDAARAAPGVVAAFAAADLDLAPAVMKGPGNFERMARPLLATDTVRFVGEAVAVVVGETAEAVADAVELVEVDYDPLAAVVALHDALDGDTFLFPDVGTNVVAAQQGGAKDPLPFDECEVVVEADVVNNRVAPCPLETRAAASMWDAEGRLHHWSSCQGAHPVRNILADYLGIPPARIQVVAPDVGGSFGAKGRPYPEELLLPVLAQRLGRPVRWIPGRSADMVGLGHGRAQLQHVRVGGDRDGTIRCLEVEILGDAGAYPNLAPMLNANTGLLLPGPYRVPHVAWHVQTVVTNTTPVVPYRGAGRPEASAAVERAVELFAAAIARDPVEVRRANLLRPDEFPHLTPTGLTLDSGDYLTALDMLLAAAGHDELRTEQSRRRADGGRRHLGIGVATFVDRTSGYVVPEYGAVELEHDGGVRVLTGSSPYGQGHHTSWAMLVADRTGLPLDRIRVEHGDTDVVPRGEVTGGSRSAQVAGNAVAQATDALVAQARERAADLLEAAAEDVVLDVGTGRFHVVGVAGGHGATWAEVAAMPLFESLKCEADYAVEAGSFPFGAYLVVVEVDADTGAVDLQRVLTVDDAGTILNPLLALGQVHGGLAQGLAQGLWEEFRYDDDGNPLTSTFADYLLPSAAELPSFECALLETPSPFNPLGFKGIGESGCLGGPPAVQSAVVDALSHLGVRHIDLPLTPEKVWRAANAAT